MTCTKTQSLITPFIHDKLNIKELEEFIDHIASCPECREELEVYYALLTAMRQLDEDRNLSDDYGLELSAKLDRAQEKIIHVKYTYYRKKAILLLIIFVLAFFLSFRYSYLKEETTNVSESNFRLRVTFRGERNDELTTILREYQEKQSQVY